MKTEFLYASINDTQSTIRSVDVRAGFVFVLLFLPLSVVDKLSVIFPLPAKLPCVFVVWIVIASILWLLAIITLFRCIVAIDNPATHVLNSNANGSFYGGDLFALNFGHAFANLPVLSARDVDGEIALLPSDETALERELVFEKIKLAYIRAAKIQRFAFAAWLTLSWLAAAGVLALLLRVHLWG